MIKDGQSLPDAAFAKRPTTAFFHFWWVLSHHPNRYFGELECYRRDIIFPKPNESSLTTAISMNVSRLSTHSLSVFVAAACFLATFGWESTSQAQPPNLKRLQQQQAEMKRRMEQQAKQAAENAPVLPNDPELLSLHREFIIKAEKLATQYERKKQYDKAREVFEAMNRLVPNLEEAEVGLARMLEIQKTEDKKFTEVQANLGWQDSGVTLQEGIPAMLDVRGTWTLVHETGPEGIEIPNEMRVPDQRVKLGSLIGIIATSPEDLTKGRPFLVRPGHEFKAPKTGRLFFRMYDIDPSDNAGKMAVQIQSTFAE